MSPPGKLRADAHMPSRPCGVTSSAARRSQLLLTHDGVRRRSLIVDSQDPVPRRIVIALHGSGFDAESHACLIDADAIVRSGVVVVLPQAAIPFRLFDSGPDGFAWNVPGAPLPGEASARHEPDDAAFVLAVVDVVTQRYPGLPVHLMGYSGGARLACHVAAATSAVASAALVAGVRFPSNPVSAPSVLAIHGRLDTVNPYDGSGDERWGVGVATATRAWARQAGCRIHPLTADLSPGVHEDRFLHPEGARLVRLVSLEHVGHAWPGTTDRSNVELFGDSGYWQASASIARFFAEVDAASAAGNDIANRTNVR